MPSKLFRVSVNVDRSDWVRFKEEAWRRRMSTSGLIRELVRECINNPAPRELREGEEFAYVGGIATISSTSGAESIKSFLEAKPKSGGSPSHSVPSGKAINAPSEKAEKLAALRREVSGVEFRSYSKASQLGKK